MQPLRRVMGDNATRTPSSRIVAQAQDFVQRGFSTRAEVCNFTRIRKRWDPALYGQLLGLSEREARCLLAAVGYEESEFGLWQECEGDPGFVS